MESGGLIDCLRFLFRDLVDKLVCLILRLDLQKSLGEGDLFVCCIPGLNI